MIPPGAELGPMITLRGQRRFLSPYETPPARFVMRFACWVSTIAGERRHPCLDFARDHSHRISSHPPARMPALPDTVSLDGYFRQGS